MTPRGLAFLPADTAGGSSEPLPNSAGAAFLTLLYANHRARKPMGAATRSKLECFALAQVRVQRGGCWLGLLLERHLKPLKFTNPPSVFPH
jgi:hypothetical protein